MPIEIPPVVANKARAAGADDWLAGLEALVGELADRWGLEVGTPYRDGTEAWVAPVVSATEGEAVLKVCVPRPGEGAVTEATVLRLAAGRGCPRLLAFDPGRSALLIERLGPSLHALGRPASERHRILCETAAMVWRPGCSIEESDRRLLATGAEKAAWLVELIEDRWEALGRPCTRAAVDHAVASGRSRAAAHDDGRSVLNHGDVHEWNALAADDGWKLVDPDGLLAEPEYDLGVVMREDPLELAADIAAGDARRRSRQLARWSGLDEAAIWEWGVVERVSTGLICVEIDLQPVGGQLLAVADRLAALG